MGKLLNTAFGNGKRIEAVSMRTARVLVVADQRHFLKFLQYVLERAGYEVAVAFDGEQALATVETSPPDAVLLDPVLPGISGFEFLRRLRAERRNRKLVVLMLLSGAQAHLCIEARKAGADSCCAKPIAPGKLLEKLEEMSVPARQDYSGHEVAPR